LDVTHSRKQIQRTLTSVASMLLLRKGEWLTNKNGNAKKNRLLRKLLREKKRKKT